MYSSVDPYTQLMSAYLQLDGHLLVIILRVTSYALDFIFSFYRRRNYQGLANCMSFIHYHVFVWWGEDQQTI